MRKRNESGYVLVVVALVLVVLLGFAALAVDFGVLYTARTQSQRAADAGALAGAFTFIINPAAPQPATAENRAVQIATANSVLGGPVAAGEVSVAVDVSNRRVTVNILRTESTLFGKVLSINTVDVGVEAVAEAAENATAASCVKPFFIPNTMLSSQTACEACTAQEVLIDSSGDRSAYADARLGMQFSLRPGGPSGAIAPGQFYSVQVDPGPGGGANAYRNAISGCAPIQFVCHELYPVEPGAMPMPTRQGIEGQPAGTDPSLIGPNPDTWGGIVGGTALYQASDGTLQETSRSLILAPVIDLCAVSGFCPTNSFPTGQTTLRMIGFAMVFIEGMDGSGAQADVLARPVNVLPCGAAGPSDPTGSTAFSVPIRLVRLP